VKSEFVVLILAFHLSLFSDQFTTERTSE